MEKSHKVKSVKEVSNTTLTIDNKQEYKNSCLNRFWTNQYSNVQFVYS